MAKPNITTRSGKGSALTYAELDANFENLQNATISVAADGNTITLDLNDTLTLNAGDNITFDVSSNSITINGEEGGGSGLTIDPDSGNYELDADFDLNGKNIFDSFFSTDTIRLGKPTTSDRVTIISALNQDNQSVGKGIQITDRPPAGQFSQMNRIELGSINSRSNIGIDINSSNDLLLQAGDVNNKNEINLYGPLANSEFWLLCEDPNGITIYQEDFSTSQSPTDTTTPSAWLQIRVGSDTAGFPQGYYIPLYQ